MAGCLLQNLDQDGDGEPLNSGNGYLRISPEVKLPNGILPFSVVSGYPP